MDKLRHSAAPQGRGRALVRYVRRRRTSEAFAVAKSSGTSSRRPCSSAAQVVVVVPPWVQPAASERYSEARQRTARGNPALCRVQPRHSRSSVHSGPDAQRALDAAPCRPRRQRRLRRDFPSARCYRKGTTTVTIRPQVAPPCSSVHIVRRAGSRRAGASPIAQALALAKSPGTAPPLRGVPASVELACGAEKLGWIHYSST